MRSVECHSTRGRRSPHHFEPLIEHLEHTHNSMTNYPFSPTPCEECVHSHGAIHA
jgi:hypothetical protein